ncbi:MAG: hypothetical protein IPN87_05975 [Saprospiraceae bacterium]|nr:hypothetical protein [Candidatus Brachybacter algidus]
MNLFRNILMLFIAVIFLDGCKDDDFPVPPASTVPQFTFIIDNESTAPANGFLPIHQ